MKYHSLVKITGLVGLVILVAVGILKYASIQKVDEIVPEISSDNIKDCGNSFSSKGDNANTIDRNCFIEAFNSCTSAKITQEVIDPNDNPIKTSVFIDSKDGDKCRVSVHVENKRTFPENDIYYCYSVKQGDLDNYHLKIDDCKDRKALFL